MSGQADTLKAKFEAMDDAALKVEADARNIRGRHLIKNPATFVDKLVAHDMQVASVDPGAMEAGAAPQRTVGGLDAKRQVPSVQERAMNDGEARREVKPVKLPPKKAPPPAAPPPPAVMQLVREHQYVVRRDFPVHTGFSMTTLAKGSVVSLRTHSKLQEFVERGLKLRRVDGAVHGLDRLGVQQTTTVYGGDEDGDLDDDAPDSGVDMRAFLQMTNDLSKAHTKIVTLEGEIKAARADLAAAQALLKDA